jgi:hypothetical protein
MRNDPAGSRNVAMSCDVPWIMVGSLRPLSGYRLAKKLEMIGGTNGGSASSDGAYSRPRRRTWIRQPGGKRSRIPDRHKLVRAVQTRPVALRPAKRQEKTIRNLKRGGRATISSTNLLEARVYLHSLTFNPTGKLPGFHLFFTANLCPGGLIHGATRS